MKSKEIPRIPGIVNRSHRTARSMLTRLISYHPFTAKTSAFIVLKVNMPILTLNVVMFPVKLKTLLLF